MKTLVLTVTSTLLLVGLSHGDTTSSPQIGDNIKTTLKTNANASTAPIPAASNHNSNLKVLTPSSAESTTFYPISTQQIQPQTRYIPLHYTYKPAVAPSTAYYVPAIPQLHQQVAASAPTTVFLLAQPSNYIPQAVYSAAAQQLVNYYHAHPQARVALINQYHQQQAPHALHASHINPVPQASYVNYQMVAAPQTTHYQLAAPPTALAYSAGHQTPVTAYDQAPQFRSAAHYSGGSHHGQMQPMQLAQIAQMAAMAAQHHSYASFGGGHHHGGAVAPNHPSVPTYTSGGSHHHAGIQGSSNFGGGSFHSGGPQQGGHFYASPIASESGHHHLNTNEYAVEDREIPSSSNFNPTYVYKNQFTKG